MLKKIIKSFGVLVFILILAAATLMVSESVVKFKVPVTLFGLNIDSNSWDAGYVSMEGTWVIKNDKQGFPLQKSVIHCYRSTGECIEAYAEIAVNQLMVGLEGKQITRWDESFITFKTDALCANYIYTLSRDTQQLTGIRKRNPESKGVELCSSLGDSDLQLAFVNGAEVWQKEEGEARPVFFGRVMLFIMIGLLAYSFFSIWRKPKVHPTR